MGVICVGLVAQGCQTYGSRGANVQLNTSKAGAVAYLVSPARWQQITAAADTPLAPYKPADLTAFRKALEPDRVTAGRTPADTTALPYRTIYVVEYGGRFWWKEIDIQPAGVRNPLQAFNLDLTE
jgi:hypothetical protein